MTNTEQIRPMFLPGGILSPDHKVGYFVNINNGIDAIDLNDGSVLWTTDVSSYPLLATNKWLVVQKRLPPHWNTWCAFKIATLALDNGSLIFQSATIFFPPWVIVPFYPPRYWGETNLNFQLRATTNRLFLDWQAQDYYRGGAAPPGFILDEYAQRKDCGTVRIDLNSGVVERLPPEDLVTDTSVEESLPSGCWIAGQKIVDLVRDRIDGQQAVQLRICDRYGEQNIEKIFELGRGEALHYIVTLDRCYILVCPNVCADVEQPWWIFASETGELAATVNYDVSDQSIGIRSIAIFNSKIYYLVDQCIDHLTHQSVLKVKDLNSGKLCWEYLVEPPKTQPPNLC